MTGAVSAGHSARSNPLPLVATDRCRKRGGLRARTPQLGVANWNLSGLMRSSCSQEQHTPELGAWAPPFSFKDRSLVTPAA
jgi:hypothetical protein